LDDNDDVLVDGVCSLGVSGARKYAKEQKMPEIPKKNVEINRDLGM
jgi:hypothetical protein